MSKFANLLMKKLAKKQTISQLVEKIIIQRNMVSFKKSVLTVLSLVAFVLLELTYLKANGGAGIPSALPLGKAQGTTYWDAVRIIENDDGIFLQTTDTKFARPVMREGNYLYYAYASDGSLRGLVTSYADLSGTDFAFTPSITSYIENRGYIASGGGTLSSNNQILTVTSMGYCGHTYIENSPYRSENLIQIVFK